MEKGETWVDEYGYWLTWYVKGAIPYQLTKVIRYKGKLYLT